MNLPSSSMKIIQVLVIVTRICFTIQRGKKFPELVSIQTNVDKHLCGGILLDLDFVVTSAACLQDIDGQYLMPNELFVKEGNSKSSDRKEIFRIFIHPQFSTNPTNDVAILHIEAFNNPDLSDILTAMNPPDVNDNDCKIMGWMKMRRETGSPSFQSTMVSLLKSAHCFTQANHGNILCVRAGFPCYGPGSALICDDELAGLGSTCSRRGNDLNEFTDLSKYNGWIDTIIRGVVYKDPAVLNQSLVADIQKSEVPVEKEDVKQDDGSAIVFPDENEDFFSRFSLQPNATLAFQLTPEQNQTIEDICKLCYTQCFPMWNQSHKDFETTKENYNCKRGVQFPYTCIYTVKDYLSYQDRFNEFQDRFDSFFSYFEKSKEKFWNGIQNYYVKEFSFPTWMNQISLDQFITPIPWLNHSYFT